MSDDDFEERVHYHQAGMKKYSRNKQESFLRKAVRHGLEAGGTLAGGILGAATTGTELGAYAGGAAGMYAADELIDYVDPIEEMEENIIDDSDFYNYKKKSQMKYKKYSKKKKYTPKRRKYTKRPRMVMTAGPRYTPELKHIDKVLPIAINGTATWIATQMGPFIIQGTDFTNRIGRRVRLTGLEFKCIFEVTVPTAIKITGDMLKCEIWHDKDTKGVGANVTDFYETNTYSAFNNATNIRRFKKIKTTNHNIVVTSLNAAGTAGSLDMMDSFTHFIKLNQEVNFGSGNTGTISDIVDHSYYCLICQGNATLTAASAVSAYVSVRFWYVDV